MKTLTTYLKHYLLLPIGLLLGIPFPIGIRWLERQQDELIPWAWSSNGGLQCWGPASPCSWLFMWDLRSCSSSGPFAISSPGPFSVNGGRAIRLDGIDEPGLCRPLQRARMSRARRRERSRGAKRDAIEGDCMGPGIRVPREHLCGSSRIALDEAEHIW